MPNIFRIFIFILVSISFHACEWPSNNISYSEKIISKTEFDMPLKLTKHAKERMKCRAIDSFEIREIINQHNINYNKSEIDAPNCKKKYAFEGVSSDQQLLRVIIAPCDNQLHVVTVIDLNSKKNCD